MNSELWTPTQIKIFGAILFIASSAWFTYGVKKVRREYKATEDKFGYVLDQIMFGGHTIIPFIFIVISVSIIFFI